MQPPAHRRSWRFAVPAPVPVRPHPPPAACARRYVVQLMNARYEPSVRVYSLPLFQEETAHRALDAVAFSTPHTPADCPQCVAWVAAYAAAGALRLVHRTADFEFVGPGACVAAAHPHALAVADHAACRALCADSPACAGYDVATCGPAPVRCRLFAVPNVSITHATFADCRVCQAKVTAPLRLLGPGRCMAGAAPAGGALYPGVAAAECRAACLAEPECVAISVGLGTATTHESCLLHFRDRAVPVPGWTPAREFPPAGGVTHAAEERAPLLCYAHAARAPAVAAGLEYRGAGACGPPPGTAPVQADGVPPPECRARCLASAACRQWDAAPCGAPNTTCRLHVADPSRWGAPFAAPRAADACCAGAARRRGARAAETRTVVDLRDSCAPLAAGETPVTGLNAPNYTSRSLSCLLEDMVVRLAGDIEAAPGSAGFTAPGEWLGALPAGFEPHETQAIALYLEDGAEVWAWIEGLTHTETQRGRLWTACGQRRVAKQSNDPGNNQHIPQYANYWAPLTRKRHIPPHPAQPQHTNDWDPRTRKRHQQEHRPQRPTERSDPTQHAKGRAGDCPGPRKGTTTRRNVTRGGLTEGRWR